MRKLKLISIFLVICLSSIIAFSPGVSAAEEQSISSAKANPMPMSMYIIFTSTNLAISSAGEAVVTGEILGNAGLTTEVWIYLYLEVYVNGSWTNETSWYQTYDSSYGTLQDTTDVASGYYYRVRASYYAFSGSDYENLVRYSNTVYH